ncbi:MAG: ABC transporter permease [Bryobacteraceae bacterium]
MLVLSNEFWKENQGGDPNSVGKTFEMNDRVHTVVGVLPPIPQFPNENDVYMPTSACPTRSSKRFIENRNARMMSVFGRLKPDATLDHCAQDVASIAKRAETEFPKSYPTGLGHNLATAKLREELTSRARPMLLVLLGAAAFVLIIACANVANLILARMARRERELVIRTAVGAGSGRLLRQLLTESLIMALLAAGVGLVFAKGSLKLLTQFAAQLTPRAREISMDGWVLLFAIACATLTTVVFGTVAALYTRTDVASGLKESDSPNTAGARRNYLRGGLITAQVAFSFVLLIGAGLMVRSLIQLDRVDPGFNPERVFAVGINLNWSKYGSRDRVVTARNYRDVSKRILAKVESQPGVVSAALSSTFPLDPETFGSQNSGAFRIEGSTVSEAETPPLANINSASPDYFRTLGIPLVKGRLFTNADHQDAPKVAIISRCLAHHRWGEADPVGRRITFDNGDTWVTIVGIVGDVKEAGLNNPPPDGLYQPLLQVPFPGSVLARSTGEPLALARQVRRAILEVDPQTAITEVKTLEEARAESISSPRTIASLFTVFGVLALVIAVTGIGSMLALSVRQRTREIGIRMALGAKPADVVGNVITQGMLLVAVGLACGVAGALELTGLLKALLFEVTPTDVATFATVAVLLFAAALLACYLPARRAAHIDPQLALRAE